jgi:hypothetical protein
MYIFELGHAPIVEHGFEYSLRYMSLNSPSSDLIGTFSRISST